MRIQTIHIQPSVTLLFAVVFLLSHPIFADANLSEPIIADFMAVPGDAEVKLTWRGSTAPASYNVKQAASATGRFIVIATNLQETSVVVTNLKNNIPYFFTISAASDDFESADTPRLRAVPSARFLDFLVAGAKLEKLASGFMSIEGPVWNPAGGYLIFSDTLGNRTLRWTPGTGISLLRPSTWPNGDTLDLQGRLLTCEGGSARSVSRLELDGSITPLVTQYKGRKFNEPNDLVVKSDGTVWFTDPTYSNTATQPGHYVYRFDPSNGNATITAVITNLNQPNGLCFSSDESKLFVADTGLMQIRLFDVLPDNSVTNSRIFIPEAADGIRATPDGRLYVTSITGGNNIKVFDPDGHLLTRLPVPEMPSNLCFAGTNREKLFITATTSLYGVTRMPDLIVTSINPFPANPREGQAVAFNLVVKNQGTAPTEQGVPLHILLSINDKTNVWAEGFTNSIPPDASVNLSGNASNEGTWIATFGTNSVQAIVDSQNLHLESNESNNALTLKLKVIRRLADADSDGFDDSDEIIAGTNPNDHDSVLKILAFQCLPGDHLALTWQSVSGKTYRLSRQRVLGASEPPEFTAPILATSDITSWTNNIPFHSPANFLRIEVIQ